MILLTRWTSFATGAKVVSTGVTRRVWKVLGAAAAADVENDMEGTRSIRSGCGEMGASL